MKPEKSISGMENPPPPPTPAATVSPPEKSALQNSDHFSETQVLRVSKAVLNCSFIGSKASESEAPASENASENFSAENSVRRFSKIGETSSEIPSPNIRNGVLNTSIAAPVSKSKKSDHPCLKSSALCFS